MTIEKQNYLIFDVETTNLDPNKAFTLSIGAIISDTEDPIGSSKEFYKLINWRKIYPKGTIKEGHFSIPENTIRVHGLTEEIIEKDENSISPISALIELSKWIQKESNKEIDILCAFNSAYDFNVLKSNVLWALDYVKYEMNKSDKDIEGYNSEECNSELKWLNNLFTKKQRGENVSTISDVIFYDLMTYDKIFHFEHEDLKIRHNLEVVGNRYGLSTDDDAHNALSDTRRSNIIMSRQIEELKEKNICIDQKLETRLYNKARRESQLWTKAQPDYYCDGAFALYAKIGD